MGKIKAAFLCLIIMVASGCAGRPVLIVEVEQTATPSPMASMTSTPTQTAFPTFFFTTATALPNTPATPVPVDTFVASTPIPPLTPLSEDANVSPIVYAPQGQDWLLLLGSVKSSGEWLSLADAVPYLGNNITMDFYQAGAREPITLSDWEYDPKCRNYFLHPSDALPGAGIGVRANWQVTARAVQEIPTDDPATAQAVGDWLRLQGVEPVKINVTRILQADLEGDGVKEVLINATYYESTVMPVTQKGDYSIVLLQRVSGNEVVTIPVVAEYYRVDATEAMYPHTYLLSNAIDLNQDGTLEIVIGSTHWEGVGASIFEVNDGIPQEVLKTTC